jgi:transketolase
MGMTTFGQSAPFADVEAEFGFTPEHVAEVAREVARGAAVNSSTT